MPMFSGHSHYQIKCIKCDVVIAQCRCFGKDKAATMGICDDCHQAKEPAPEALEDEAKFYRDQLESFKDDLFRWVIENFSGQGQSATVNRDELIKLLREHDGKLTR